MKNLKRVLALVLVVAMFAGLMITTNAAFTDGDDVVNVEAVEVLSALGVIEGYDDGSYKPEKEVTRAEMAAIICRLVLGGAAEAVAGDSDTGFSDVADNHWAAGYISYCVSKGIIDGYEDGTFAPGKTVTKAEAAKMVLCALGVKGEYTGKYWATNVALDAMAAKLIADSKGMNAGCTRDAVALIGFNALSYSKTGTSTTDWAYDPIKGEWVNRTTAGSDSLAVAVHKLAKAAPAADVFGRPDAGYYYTVNGLKATGVFGTSKNLVATYKNAPVVAKSLYTVANADVTATYVKNGVAQTAVAVNKTNVATVGGLGSVVEVYYDKVAKSMTLVEYTYELGTVTEVVKHKVDAYGDVVTMGTVKVGALTYAAGPAAETFKKGDVVTYTYVGSAAYDVAKAAVVSGDLTAISSKGVYTIGGVGYTSRVALSIAKGGSYYLDPLGNVVGTVAAADVAPNYAYVLSTDYSLALVSGKLQYSYVATVAFVDGSVQTVAIDKASFDAAKLGLYTYTVKNDVYTLKAAEATTISSVTKGKTALAAGVYANANTLFVVADYVKNEKNELVIAGTVTLYKGIANVPSMNTMTAVVLGAEKDAVADVVFVGANKATVDAVKANYVYFTGAWSTVDGVNYTYDVVVAGKAATMTFEGKVVSAAGLYDVDGATVNAVAPAAKAELKFVGGLLMVNDVYAKDIAADAPVYVFDATGAVTVLTAADLAVAVEGTYVVAENAKVATLADALYIFVA